MNLSPNAYALLGLTAIVACMIALLTYALMRFVSVSRQMRKNIRGDKGFEAVFMSSALQDAVTKLKAQERATAARADASERLSEDIIAGLTAGLAVVGVGGNVRTLNPAGRRMLDLSETATPTDFRAALNSMLLTGVIDECLRTGAALQRRVVTLPSPRHGVSCLGVSVSPLGDVHGGKEQLHGAICLFTDLTEVKDLEEQLRLKDSLATVGELTAGIAHEFRNGLATIQGYSKLIDLAQLPESYRPYVQGIRAETESLGQVVTNFLNFARPEQLTLTNVDLAALCERTAEEVRADARLAGGDVTVSGEFGRITGDEVLLKQAFSNLLRNALEACVGSSKPPKIAVRGEIDRSQRVFRVAVDDNGPGIPAEMRERIFRPFVTSKRSGTGLGLALVQKIVVFHNGRIVAGSSPAGGASFQVTLPIGG